MKYTGKLQKPVVKRRLGLLASDADFKAEFNRQFDEMAAKLPELCSVHGVKVGDWLALAFALAKEHVRGFRVEQPAGRTTKWSAFDKAEFRVDVEAMRSTNPDLKVTQAMSRVQKQPNWAEKTKGMKLPALRKHYDAADQRSIKLVRNSRAWDALSEDDKNQFRETLHSEESIVLKN